MADVCMQNWPEEGDEGPVEFRYLCGSVDHTGALEEAGVTEADAIIIGPAEDLPDNEVRGNNAADFIIKMITCSSAANARFVWHESCLARLACSGRHGRHG